MTRLVGIAVLAALPSLAQAQAAPARAISFGVSGGASLPMGNLGDIAETGYNLGAHILLSPPSFTNLSFRGDVTFDRWALKGTIANAADANLRALGVAANAIFRASSAMTMRPYAIGGVGFYSAKGSGTIGGLTVSDESDNNFGIQAGAGLEFQLSGFTTFLEAKFVNVFSENNSTNWVPVTFGIRF